MFRFARMPFSSPTCWSCPIWLRIRASAAARSSPVCPARVSTPAPSWRRGGLPLGTVSVLDVKPRQGLSVPEAQALRALARQVIAQLELRSLLRVAKASEAALAQAVCERDALLREKDLLIDEVHHRVKNSLQLVQTLVTLQARDVTDPTAQAQLQETAGRIRTIGAVHGRLYTGGSATNSLAEPFLAALVRDIQTSIGSESDRRVELRVEPMVLSADRLTALGLVITELVTNALKYGEGRILVCARRVGQDIEVAVEDEGRGLSRRVRRGAERQSGHAAGGGDVGPGTPGDLAGPGCLS